MEFLYIAISRISGGVKGYAMKRAGDVAHGGDSSLCINLIRSAVCLAVSAMIWIISGVGMCSPLGNLFAVISGICNAMTVYFWILASQMVSVSLIEVFSMLGSVILPLMLAPVLYNGDSASPIQWAGAAVLVIAALLLADDEKRTKTEHPLFVKIATVFFQVIGVSGAAVTQKLYTFHVCDKGEGSIEYFNFATFVVVCLLFVAIFLVKHVRAMLIIKRGNTDITPPFRNFPLRRVWIYIVFAAVGLYVSQHFATLASTLPSAILFPVSYGMSILVCFVLDTAFFGKRLTLKRIIAFFTVLLAILLVNL